jgi:exodeoxyribonuclease V alpha subunit
VIPNDLDLAFARLAKSKFRSRFALDDADRQYVAQKGMDVIRRHAEDFVRQRLAPAQPRNDGRQTPMRGHPVFKAQHATATCCRGCLNKWWGVPLGVELSAADQQRVVDLILAWIERQMLPQK